MIYGKANDDGYRGLHLYKYEKNSNIGELLRKKYDNGKIKNEVDFKEAMKNVLSSGEEI